MRIMYEIFISLTGNATVGEVTEIIHDLNKKHDCSAVLMGAINTSNPLKPIKCPQKHIDKVNSNLVQLILEER